MITPAQHRWARRQPIGLRPGRLYEQIREPYFFGYVRDQLVKAYGAETVRSGGLKVYTTIEPRWQRLAQKAIADTLTRKADPAAAIVSIDPANGAIRAMTAIVPGRANNQFNLLSQARRQPGSTFKTFVLAAAVERGMDPSSTYYVSAPFTYRPTGRRQLRRRQLVVRADLRLELHGLDVRRAGDAALRQLGLRAADARRRPGTGRLDGPPARRSHAAAGERRVPACDGPRLGRGLSARHGVGLCDARRRRHLHRAHRDPQGDPERQARRPLGRASPPHARRSRRRRIGRDAHPRGQRPLRDGNRRGAQPARCGQDRHDRQARRCLVRRVHAGPLDRCLDGLHARRGADDERPRHLRLGRVVPGADLAPVHGSRAGRASRPRLPGARPAGGVPAVAPRAVGALATTRTTWLLRARRRPPRRRRRRPRRRRTRRRRFRRRRRRTPRRRRPPRTRAPVTEAPPRTAAAPPSRDLQVGAARRGRRHGLSRRDRVGHWHGATARRSFRGRAVSPSRGPPGSSSPCSPPRSSRTSPASSSCAAVRSRSAPRSSSRRRCSSFRSRRRSCSRPTPGRTGATAGSRRRAAETRTSTRRRPFPRARPPPTSAPTGATRPACTARRSRSSPSRSRGSRARRPTRPRGSSRASPRSPCWSRPSPSPEAPDGPRSRPRSSAGTRCSPIHAGGGGHNDALVGALVATAVALGVHRRASRERRRVGARGARQVGAARLLRAGGARRARPRASDGRARHSSRPWPPAARSPRGATASTGSARSAHSPTTPCGGRATRSPRGSSSSASRTGWRSGLRSPLLARGPRLARPGRARRPRAARGRRLPRPRDDALPRRLVPRVGGAPRGTGGRRPARAARGARRSRRTCCRRRSRSEAEHDDAVLVEHDAEAAARPKRGERTPERARRVRLVAVARPLLVDRDPGRVAQHREAEDAAPLGQVRSERVRRAHGRVRGDQPRPPSRRPGRDARRRARASRGRSRAARRARREAGRGAHPATNVETTTARPLRPVRPREAPPQPRRAEHRGDEQPRQRAGRVVEVDRRLRPRARRGGSAAARARR